MSFGEASQQMPLYSKFLKDMLTRKHKYIHQENIVVEGNCSVVIQKILPPKNKDPGSVTIPCLIGEVTMGKALLGASINLMPFSMCRRLGNAFWIFFIYNYYYYFGFHTVFPLGLHTLLVLFMGS